MNFPYLGKRVLTDLRDGSGGLWQTARCPPIAVLPLSFNLW